MVSLVSKGILQLCVLVFFARYLTQEEFGIISIVTSLMVFITLFSEIGLGPALIQRQNVSGKHLQVASFSAFAIALMVYLILFISAPSIASFYKEPALQLVLRVVGVAFIFASLGNVSFSLLRKELDFNSILVVELTSFIIGYGIVGVSMAFLGMGLWAYIVAIVVQSAVSTLLLWVKKPQRLDWGWHKEEFLQLFNFGGWLTVENLVNMLARQSDVFLTGRLLGMSLLGLYGRAYQIIDIPNQYIGMALDNVLFPAMAQKQHDRASIATSYLRGVSIANLFMFPLAVFLCLQAEPIMEVVFGKQWMGAVPVMQWLCLTLPFKTTVKIADSLVRALGAFQKSALLKGVFFVAMVIGVAVGSRWGLWGVAIGVNAAISLNYLLMTALTFRLVAFTLSEFFKTYFPGCLLSAMVASVNALVLHGCPLFCPLTAVETLLAGLVLTTLVVTSSLLFFPRMFGQNWKWLLSQLMGYVPNHKRLLGMKTYLQSRMLG